MTFGWALHCWQDRQMSWLCLTAWHHIIIQYYRCISAYNLSVPGCNRCSAKSLIGSFVTVPHGSSTTGCICSGSWFTSLLSRPPILAMLVSGSHSGARLANWLWVGTGFYAFWAANSSGSSEQCQGGCKQCHPPLGRSREALSIQMFPLTVQVQSY